MYPCSKSFALLRPKPTPDSSPGTQAIPECRQDGDVGWGWRLPADSVAVATRVGPAGEGPAVRINHDALRAAHGHGEVGQCLDQVTARSQACDHVLADAPFGNHFVAFHGAHARRINGGLDAHAEVHDAGHKLGRGFHDAVAAGRAHERKDFLVLEV